MIYGLGNGNGDSVAAPPLIAPLPPPLSEQIEIYIPYTGTAHPRDAELAAAWAWANVPVEVQVFLDPRCTAVWDAEAANSYASCAGAIIPPGVYGRSWQSENEQGTDYYTKAPKPFNFIFIGPDGGHFPGSKHPLELIAQLGPQLGLSPDFDWLPYFAAAAKRHFDQFGRGYHALETYYGYPVHMALQIAAENFPENTLLPLAVAQTAQGTEFGNQMYAWRRAMLDKRSATMIEFIALAAIFVAPVIMAGVAAAGAGAATGASAGTVATSAELSAIFAAEDTAMAAALAGESFTAVAAIPSLAADLSGAEWAAGLQAELGSVETLAAATPAQTSLLTQAAEFMGLDSLEGALINMGKQALSNEVKKALMGEPPKSPARAPAYLQPPSGTQLQPGAPSGTMGDNKFLAWGAALAAAGLAIFS